MLSLSCIRAAIPSFLRDDLIVTTGFKTEMSFNSDSKSIVCLPAAGAQEPFSINPTVRFCRLRAFISCRKFSLAG